MGDCQSDRLERDLAPQMAYVSAVTRDIDESRPSIRWSDPPGFDPHRDVSGALHDVSNVLTVLLGWVARAQAAQGSTDELQRSLGMIEERARSARDLARRAIGARSPVDDREDELGAVVQDVVDALLLEAQRVNVSFEVIRSGQPATVPLAADIGQILTNILLNALAWAPKGSRVVVRVEAMVTECVVTIEDDGPGIAPSVAEAVFSGGSGREGGAGIGLRHARSLARAAGGNVELVVDPSRRGACFRVRWPRTQPSLSRPSVASSPGVLLMGKRALVVEDDREVAELLETALGVRGATVVVARNAAELAESAKSGHDIALVDLSPIADDVPGALDTLRRNSPRIKIVFISGSVGGLPEGQFAQGIRWVRKPFEIGEILAAVSDAR